MDGRTLRYHLDGADPLKVNLQTPPPAVNLLLAQAGARIHGGVRWGGGSSEAGGKDSKFLSANDMSCGH